MAFVNGLLNLGTALSGTMVVTPSVESGYTALPVSYDVVSGGITLNTVNCVFGPVSGSWGTLTSFGVTDLQGNPAWAGTLAIPFTPADGQIVIAPVGQIQLALGTQYSVGPSSNWFAQPPVLVAGSLGGNPGPGVGGLQAVTVASGLIFSGSVVGLNAAGLPTSSSGLPSGAPYIDVNHHLTFVP